MKFSLISTILIVAILFALFIFNKPIYGNDEESIVKVIHSVEGYEDGLVEILEIKDINDERFVAFLYNNSPACIQFYKNKQDNYKWHSIEKRDNESFSQFNIHLINNESPNYMKMMIVTNQNNRIAKMRLKINNEIQEKKFNVNQKTVSWINFPESIDNSYSYDYEFFDQNGNKINE